MQIVKTENEEKPWRLYGKGGLVFTAETQEELIDKVLSEYEQMREVLSEVHTIAHVGKQWPYDTKWMVQCFNEIKELAGQALNC